MRKNKFPRRCWNCKFFTRLSDIEFICDYINKTGEPRGCPIDNKCDKRKLSDKNRNKQRTK